MVNGVKVQQRVKYTAQPGIVGAKRHDRKLGKIHVRTTSTTTTIIISKNNSRIS